MTRIVLPVQAETWDLELPITGPEAYNDGIYGNQSDKTTVAGTYPWVDSIDGDSSYVSGKMPEPGGNAPFLFCHMPAITVTESDITRGKFVVIGRYIEGTSTDFTNPADDPSGTTIWAVRKGTPIFGLNANNQWNVSGADFDYWRIERSLIIDDDGAPPSVWVEAFAAGSVALTLRWGLTNNFDLHEWRVTYVAVEFPDTPPLRQNQRDDIRQGQRTSRQLTVRQVGYL